MNDVGTADAEAEAVLTGLQAEVEGLAAAGHDEVHVDEDLRGLHVELLRDGERTLEVRARAADDHRVLLRDVADATTLVGFDDLAEGGDDREALLDRRRVVAHLVGITLPDGVRRAGTAGRAAGGTTAGAAAATRRGHHALVDGRRTQEAEAVVVVVDLELVAGDHAVDAVALLDEGVVAHRLDHVLEGGLPGRALEVEGHLALDVGSDDDVGAGEGGDLVDHLLDVLVGELHLDRLRTLDDEKVRGAAHQEGTDLVGHGLEGEDPVQIHDLERDRQVHGLAADVDVDARPALDALAHHLAERGVIDVQGDQTASDVVPAVRLGVGTFVRLDRGTYLEKAGKPDQGKTEKQGNSSATHVRPPFLPPPPPSPWGCPAS